ncbi:unnamed protein product [Rhizopus stolonifer]
MVNVEKVKELTGADSAMIARGAQMHPSAFRKEGILSFHETVSNYMKKAIDVDNVFQNSKYCILCMNTEDSDHTRSDLYNNMQRAKSTEVMCDVLGLREYYDKVQKEHKAKLEKVEKVEKVEPTEEKAEEKSNKRSREVEEEFFEKKQKTDE